MNPNVLLVYSIESPVFVGELPCVAVVYQVLSKVEMTEEAQDLQRGMELADEALEEQAALDVIGGSVRLSMLG